MQQPILVLALFIHIAAAIVWLGGMVFAHFALRPAATALLQPPQRLPLMAAALGRFFKLVAVAVLAIVGTGLWLLLRVGMAQAPMGWHIMLLLGLVMAAVFAYIFAACYPRMRNAVAQEQWPLAAQALNRIRQLVALNMVLGFVTVAAAVSVRW